MMTGFDKKLLQQRLQILAAEGVLIGTSSWKYQGWREALYDSARYEYRNKFAVTRFERNCLSEYAEVFKTVCVDAAYYTFPSTKYLEGLSAQVPDDFQFAFKITDSITIKRFPNHARHGGKAGRENPDFLNAAAFVQGFLRPCESIRSKIGILMFEFSKFYPSDFEHGRDFVAVLDTFLAKLPKGWPYGIEMRNKYWLKQEYFECLARHGIAHIYNSWTDMPPVGEQIELPGSETNPELTAARFLLKPGRPYEEAVKNFQPYDKAKEVNEPARKAGAKLIEAGKEKKRKRTFLFINNRLEGNALETIKAILDLADNRAGE